MPRDDSRPSRDPESKRPGATPREGDRNGERNGDRNNGDRAAGWNPRRGHSGYGVESIRPHLRAQLEQQKLLRPTFPPEPDEEPPEGGKRR